MTRARALKQAIRARAARTGERYTTARRHVLRDLKSPQPAAPAASWTPATATAAPQAGRTGISDARILEKTGHHLDFWFEVLDRFDATTKGHTAAARHLSEEHGVGPWYAQSITVAYERARGLRAVNQRGGGDYEVSVSKMIASDVASLVAILSDPRARRRLQGGSPYLLASLAAALAAPGCKGFTIRADGQGRFRYKWDGSVVQFYLYPKAAGKMSIVVTEAKLPSRDAVEERRTAWRGTLSALAAAVQR